MDTTASTAHATESDSVQLSRVYLALRTIADYEVEHLGSFFRSTTVLLG